MARVLLDTDVIIWYLRGRESVHAWVQEISRDGVPRCSALSVTEVVSGMRPKEESATREFLQALRVIDVDRGIAWHAGELIHCADQEGGKTVIDLLVHHHHRKSFVRRLRPAVNLGG